MAKELSKHEKFFEEKDNTWCLDKTFLELHAPEELKATVEEDFLNILPLSLVLRKVSDVIADLDRLLHQPLVHMFVYDTTKMILKVRKMGGVISIKAIPQLESTCSGFDADVMNCLTEFYPHIIEESVAPVHSLVTCLGLKVTKTLRGKTCLDFVWRQMQANLEARVPVNMNSIHEFRPFLLCLSQKDTDLWQHILKLSVAGATGVPPHPLDFFSRSSCTELVPVASPSSSSNYNPKGCVVSASSPAA